MVIQKSIQHGDLCSWLPYCSHCSSNTYLTYICGILQELGQNGILSFLLCMHKGTVLIENILERCHQTATQIRVKVLALRNPTENRPDYFEHLWNREAEWMTEVHTRLLKGTWASLAPTNTVPWVSSFPDGLCTWFFECYLGVFKCFVTKLCERD